MGRALKREALVEIRVFGFGLFQNGNVRAHIFPERKEILIGGFRFGLITRQCISSVQLQSIVLEFDPFRCFGSSDWAFHPCAF
jgi:hypothetical protein